MYFRQRRRILHLGLSFLLINCFASVCGLCTVYAFFGKPYSDLCMFRMWLVMLSSNFVISSLTTCQLRVYLHFSQNQDNLTFTETKFISLVSLLIIPELVMLIIWTSAFPLEAKVENDHVECSSNGNADYVFYGLFLAYKGILLSLSAVLAFLSRNYPSPYSDAKLIAIAIYNALVISAILIPIVISLGPLPFARWIFLCILIILFFLGTYIIIMLPKIVGILFIDRNFSTEHSALEVSRTSSSKTSEVPRTE